MTDAPTDAPTEDQEQAPASTHTLSSKAATLVVAGLLLVALVAGSALLPAPYLVEGPGPTEDVLGSVQDTPVVRIEGRRTYPTDGQLRLTTVNYTSCATPLTLWGGLQGWFDSRREVVPRGLVCPEGSTPEQVEEQNAEAMSRSQEAAKVAALREVGIDVPQTVVVEAVQQGAPALGRLRAGDVLRAVDGRPVTTPEEVGRLVRARRPGDTIAFAVSRDGRDLDVSVTAGQREIDGQEVTAVGIVPAPGYDIPFEVDVTLAERIGGPSAGLVFALGIVDKLTPGSLTGGEDVAGTGVISADGAVGPIGGIRQKVYGAEDAGATVFLAPAGNCGDLSGVDTGLRIVRVETLSGAVDALDTLVAGRTDVPACS